MKTFDCVCGSSLFFESTRCVRCRREVGWCPGCRSIAALEGDLGGIYRCARPACGAKLKKCDNYAYESVCNRMVRIDQRDNAPRWCDCCRYNAIIPDLRVAGHRQRWAQLEAAKRRLIYTLDLLGLPHGTQEEGFNPPLSFAFMTDELPDGGFWWSTDATSVYTGHFEGRITINVKEADAVERERLRVSLNEAHRTLIGHFRHEIGHYYWALLVRSQREESFAQTFGPGDQRTYQAAFQHFHQYGPLPRWQESFLSAYATMHPWEDFAECFAFYLTVVAVTDTAQHWGLIEGPRPDETLDDMLTRFHQAGLAMNELNRERGLKDLVSEIVTPPIVRKLAYIDRLVFPTKHGCHPGR